MNPQGERSKDMRRGEKSSLRLYTNLGGMIMQIIQGFLVAIVVTLGTGWIFSPVT